MPGTTLDRSAGESVIRRGGSPADAIVRSYSYGIYDFGPNADELFAIGQMAGKRFCQVLDVEVQATETFTTGGAVLIGTASDSDKFAELTIGTLADTDALNSRGDTDAIFTAGKFIDMSNDGDSGAAITQLEVTFQRVTQSGPAGQGFVHICLAWW